MIDVRHLTKRFETNEKTLHAVDDVSFHVKKGEIYGIIGLSGAGKSTLVRCLNRLEEPDEGEIFIDGVDIMKLDKKALLAERRDIGMIFQAFNLFHQKNVRDNIAYPLEISGLGKDSISSRVDELLDFVDLKEKARAYPRELSGGQKQRVAIARALAMRPKILLSDEGTSALDPQNTKSILDVFQKAVEELGTTIVLITHQMEVAKDVCDRIAVMESGKIIEENTVAELFRAPKHPRTSLFIQTLQTQEGEPAFDRSAFDGTILRLSYDDATSREPIISNLSREYGARINIISGKINRIGDASVGHMIVELEGSGEETGQILRALEERNVTVEVL